MLQYASERLKNDNNIISKAVENKFEAFKYVSKNFKNFLDILFINLNFDKKILNNINKYYYQNLNFLLNDNKFIKLSDYIINKKNNNFWFIFKNLKYLIKYKHIQEYLLKNKNKIINNWNILCIKEYCIVHIDILEEILNIKFIDISLY